MTGLAETANVTLIVIVALGTIAVVALLAVVAVAVVKLNRQIEKIANMAEPVAVKASDALESVQRVTMSVGEKADHILTRGVALSDTVSNNVERTASVVEQTVTTPLIKLSSLIAGVSKTISVYTGTARHNGHSNSTKQSKE